MSQDLNLKLISFYKKSTIKKLIKIFGEDYVFPLPQVKAVGLSYNYEDRKLKTLFKKIPFKETEQFYISPKQFLRIIRNLVYKGIKPHINMNIELPEEVKESLSRIMHELLSERERAFMEIRDLDLKMYWNALEDILDYLGEEYGADITSVSYYNGEERISIQANGILFTDMNSISLTDEILNFRGI